jgi:hypothetical protein
MIIELKIETLEQDKLTELDYELAKSYYKKTRLQLPEERAKAPKSQTLKCHLQELSKYAP